MNSPLKFPADVMAFDPKTGTVQRRHGLRVQAGEAPHGKGLPLSSLGADDGKPEGDAAKPGHDEAQLEGDQTDGPNEPIDIGGDAQGQLAFDWAGGAYPQGWQAGGDFSLSDYDGVLADALDGVDALSPLADPWHEGVLVAGIQPVPLVPVLPEASKAVDAAPPGSSPTPAADGAKGEGAEPVAAPAQDAPPIWLGGLALLGGGGGGGGAAAAPSTPSAPVVQFTLSGVISLGRVTDTTGLVIEAFKADGTRLAANSTLHADGRFELGVTDRYSGVVLVRLKDLDAIANYHDEATGVAKDVTSDLRAMINVSGSGTTTVALNPLTELAVRKLLGDSGGDGGATGTVLGASVSAAQVAAVNTAVAKALGLTGEVSSTVPVTVDDPAFSSGSTAAQAYGQALAAISGMEANSGSSTDNVLNVLAQGMTVSGSSAALSTPVVNAFVLGAAKADEVPGNAAGAAAALNAVLDGVGPQVTGITVVAADAPPLALGESIEVKVQFNDSVEIDGALGWPTVALALTWANGSHDASATYVGGAGTPTLTFRYAIDVAGLGDAKVSIAVPANGLQAGLSVLSDVLGNTADLNHATTQIDTPVAVDTIAPTVSQIAVAGAQGMAAGLLNTGDTVTITVGLSEAVQVDTSQGAPELNVWVGDKSVPAAFASVSSSGTEVNFLLTIAAGQLDVDGISIAANALVVGDANWTDVAGNPVIIKSAQVAANPTYKVDAVAPAAPTRPDLAAADDTGASISDNITSNTSALRFSGVAEANSTVVVFDDANDNGQVDAGEELARKAASELGAWDVKVSLSEGAHAIRALAIDSAGNQGALASSVATVMVDDTAPSLKGFSTPAVAGAYQAGESITLVATASEELVAGGRILVTLSSGAQVVLMAEGHSALLSGTYTIGDTGFAGDLRVVSYQDVAGAPVKDVAGKALVKAAVDAGMANIPTGSVVIDTVAPTVTEVKLVPPSDTANPWLSVGDVVAVDVTLSEAVFVGSSPLPSLRLSLDAFGASSVGEAQFASGSGTNTLRFEYTVVADDSARGGVAVVQNGLSLNQATLQDSAGNAANLDFAAVAANSAVKVMTTGPEVTAVGLPNQAMAVGSTVQVTLTVSDDGGVAYNHIQGQIGGFALSGLTRVDATTYHASFTVSEGGADVAADADIPVLLSVVDAAGNASVAYTTPISSGNADRIDAHTPALAQVALASPVAQVVNHALSEGDTLAVTLVFSEPVYVSGAPTLPLSLGGALTELNYLAGSGSMVLTFGRPILPGETDTDGVSFLANALLLNGGHIVDAAGQAASLTHAALSAGGYLIDTTAPVVTAFYTDKAAGQYRSGAQVNVYASMSEAVSPTSELEVLLNTGATVILRTMDGDATTMVGTYPVASGENTASLAVTSITVAGVYDLAGNAIIQGSLPVNNLPLSQANAAVRGDVVVDTSAPTTPAQLVLDAADNTGTDATASSFTDATTAQTTGLSLSTLVEAGSTVKLYDGNTLLNTQLVTNGQWASSVNLVEGIHQLKVTSTDVAGNTSATSTTLTLVVDTTAPTVDSIEIKPGTGAVGARLNVGDTVNVDVHMSEVTWVDLPVGGAKPAIALDVGGQRLTASYSSGSGSSILTFSAVVDASMSDADGVAVVANSLTTGAASITDVAGNSAVLAHGAIATGTPVLVDNLAPTVLGAVLAGKVSSTGVLVWQDTVYADVNFSEAVQIKTGATPTLALKVGSTLVDATYLSGSGTSTWRFAYTVGANLTDDNGISVPTGALALNPGDITDLAGNALGNAGFSGTTDNASYIVDATPPTVQSVAFVSATGMADGWINAGDTMQWQVTLSEAVNIAGTPRLLLNVGGQDVYATYVQGSGNQNLMFKATFAAGLEDHDGLSIAADSLQNSGGVLIDGQGNAVDLSHAALAAQADYPIDTLNPHVVSITSSTEDGWYKAGTSIQISAVFNESLAASGGIITAVLNTGESVTLNQWDNSKTLSGTYVVGGSANSFDLAVTRITVDAAPHDLAGNAMTLWGDVSALGLTNLDMERAIVVDTVAPDAPSIPALVIADDTGVSSTDNRTRVAVGTTMSGTAEAYATVTVFDDLGNDGLLTSRANELVGEVIASADGTWTLDLTRTLADGAHLIRAMATDRAGNVGLVSGGVEITVDTIKPIVVGLTIPDAPMKVGDVVVATITVGNDSNDTYYNVQGTVNGFALGHLTRMNATTYTATFTVTEGGHDVLAGEAIELVGLTIDDSAGNRSDAISTTIVEASDAIDANSPRVSSLAITGADNMAHGYLNAGDVVYATVVMNEDTVVTGTPQLKLAMGSQTVLATYDSTLSDATHLVFAYTIVNENDADGIAIPADALVLPLGTTLTDGVGNNAILASAAVASDSAYLVDTVAPVRPVQVDLASADDLGVSNADNTTKQSTALTFSGTAEANSTVTLFADANADGVAQTAEVLATLSAATNGAWSKDVTLAEGGYGIRVIATDAAGNTSLASDVLNAVVDTTAPTVTGVALGDSVGLLNAYLNAGDQLRVVLSLAEVVVVNSTGGVPTLTVNIGGIPVEASYLSGSGSDSLVFSYTIQNTQNDADGVSVAANSLVLHGGAITDVAGNAVVLANAAVTNDASQMVDTVAPAKPAATSLAAADDSGSSASDAITSTTSGLSFSGSGETGATLALFADANTNGVMDTGESLGTTTIANGLWGMDIGLSEGEYRLRSVVIDAAGNISQASDALLVKVDVTAPVQPGALSLIASSDSGRSITDGVTQVDSGLTFSVTAEAGSTVAIYEGTTLLATTLVNGNLRLNAALSEGVHTLYAKATDAAGNVSVDGVLSTVNVDTTAPAQPGAISLASADDLGISNSDLLTSKSAGLSLSGNAEDNATVDVYDDANQNGILESNEKLGSTLAASGRWSLDVALSAGTHHIRAQAIDAAGNASSASAELALTVDVTEPAVAALQAYDVAGAGGYSRGDQIELVFSEAVQVAGVTLANLLLNNGHTLGTGALIQAQAPVAGMATSYWVTLGNAPTLAAGDTLSLSAASVVDKAGNTAAQAVEFMVPLASPGTIRLATAAGAESLTGTAVSDHFVAVGLTIAGQYLSSQAVLGSAAVAAEITRANSVSTVNLGDAFTGGTGFDVLSLYGTADLQAGVSLTGIERLQIFGEVTMTSSQIALLNTAAISLSGAGQGILHIVDDGGVADFSGIRLADLAQLDVGDGVKVVLSQDNLDQIGAVSGGWSGAQVQAQLESLDWTGVTVYGGADALTAEGGNLGALSLQAGATNGDSILSAVNASLTAANALLSGSLTSYTQTVFTASDFDAVLSGAPGVEHTMAAFGAAQHWLVGDSLSDKLVAGSGGDLLWGGTELQQNAGIVNTLIGGAGNDVVVSGSNIDTITTGAGDDYIDAGAGADIIRGGAGNDFIRSGTGTDVIQFEADLATNGVDLFGAGVVGDVFDFSAMQAAGGFLGLTTTGTNSVWNTTLAGLSDLANHSAAFIVLRDAALGDAAALKAALDQTKFDTVDKEGSRVVVWANNAGLVDMAFVKNADGLNDDSVSVNVFAHMMMTTSQTPSIFLNGLSDAHFVV